MKVPGMSSACYPWLHHGDHDGRCEPCPCSLGGNRVGISSAVGALVVRWFEVEHRLASTQSSCLSLPSTFLLPCYTLPAVSP